MLLPVSGRQHTTTIDGGDTVSRSDFLTTINLLTSTSGLCNQLGFCLIQATYGIFSIMER